MSVTPEKSWSGVRSGAPQETPVQVIFSGWVRVSRVFFFLRFGSIFTLFQAPPPYIPVCPVLLRNFQSSPFVQFYARILSWPPLWGKGGSKSMAPACEEEEEEKEH